MIAGKTGSLIAVVGTLRRDDVRRRRETVSVLTQYGERVGVAFQLADDVLDIASDSQESGKTPGTDLREGIPTLPVLHCANGPPRRRAAPRTANWPPSWPAT